VILIIAFGIITILASGGGDEEDEEMATSWEKVIGPEGGTVEVTEPSISIYGMKIEIPAGALAEPATIIISEPESTELLDALPTGLIGYYAVTISSDSPFLQDVKITFPIQGIPSNDGEILSAFYYQTSNGSWTIVSSTQINENQLIIETDHLSLWSWGTVNLEEVEQETVTTAIDEFFGGYNELRTAVENKIMPFISTFSDLTSMLENWLLCEDRQNIANLLNNIISETESEIDAYLNSPGLLIACKWDEWVQDPFDPNHWVHVPYDPYCTLTHMLVTDEQMRLKKWAEVEIRAFFGEIFWNALPGGGGVAGDVLMNAVGKSLIEGQYRYAVEHELGCDYRCVFKNGGFDFIFDVVVCNLSYMALFAMDIVESHHPCFP
jgi:hypothetical protein